MLEVLRSCDWPVLACDFSESQNKNFFYKDWYAESDIYSSHPKENVIMADIWFELYLADKL